MYELNTATYLDEDDEIYSYGPSHNMDGKCEWCNHPTLEQQMLWMDNEYHKTMED
jgi:hypothetical protein